MNDRMEVKHLEGLKWMLKHDYVHQMDRVWIAGVIKELEAQQQAEPTQAKNAQVAATPSEDGWEVPKFDRRAIADRVNRMCVLMAGANTLNAAEFAVEECQSELERIVAAKDAEIARLRQHKNDYMEAAEETARALRNEINDHQEEIRRLDALVAELSAQPSRQVVGDERETAIAQFALTLPMTSESAAGGNTYDQELRRYYLLGWDDRAALAPAAVAVVLPERMVITRYSSDEYDMCAKHWNEALDSVARLNRRAIPVGLLERVCKDYTGRENWDALEPDRLAAAAELRALLGKEVE